MSSILVGLLRNYGVRLCVLSLNVSIPDALAWTVITALPLALRNLEEGTSGPPYDAPWGVM